MKYLLYADNAQDVIASLISTYTARLTVLDASIDYWRQCKADGRRATKTEFARLAAERAFIQSEVWRLKETEVRPTRRKGAVNA